MGVVFWAECNCWELNKLHHVAEYDWGFCIDCTAAELTDHIEVGEMKWAA